ncbi:MAG: hypothetical protein ACYTE8_00920 [Planctomycetota bacterium]|jgi:hypothetical protein
MEDKCAEAISRIRDGKCPYFKKAEYPENTYRLGYCNDSYWDCTYFHIHYTKCPDYIEYESEKEGEHAS